MINTTSVINKTGVMDETDVIDTANKERSPFMKKIIAIAAALMIASFVTSCGPDEPNNPNSGTEQPVDNETQYINKIKSWIEKLKQLTFQVDKPVNLLQGLDVSYKEIKFELNIDGETTVINNPYSRTGEYPCNTCTLDIAITNNNGKTYKYSIEKNIKPLEYHPIQLQKINLQDSLPKIDSGNNNIAKDLERFGYVSTRCIVDMGLKYGLGGLTPEEYRQKLQNYCVGIVGERPTQNDYDIIGPNVNMGEPSHAHKVWSIVDGMIHRIPFHKVVQLGTDDVFFNVVDQNPSLTYILGNSTFLPLSKQQYETIREEQEQRKKAYDNRKIIYIITVSNVEKNKQGEYQRGLLQKDKKPKQEYETEYIYSEASFANGTNENTPSGIGVATGCKLNGDLNITDATSGPKIPSGFSPSVTYGGVPYPRENVNGVVFTDEIPPTSYATPNIVGSIALCAAVYPHEKYDLLNMVQKTAETRNMTLHNETVQVKIPNPAGVAREAYITPINIPTTIKAGEFIEIDTKNFGGIVFDVPGFVVRINGERIPYTNENKSKIQMENPFKIKRGIDGSLCKKYSQNGKVTGPWKMVKDTWEDILINSNNENTITINIQ